MNSHEKIALINKMKWRNLIGSRILSFFGGLHFFINLSLNIFLKDKLHLEPIDMATIRFLQSLPWTVRPLYGLTTDLIPIFGYKQKSYLIILFFINSLSWIIISFNTHSIILLRILFVVIQLTLAFIGVVNRVIITETGRLYEDVEKKTKENINNASTTLQLGRLVASLLEGYIAQKLIARHAFLLSSAAPLLVLIAAFLIIEKDSRIREEDIFFSFTSKHSLQTGEEMVNRETSDQTKVIQPIPDEDQQYFRTSRRFKIKAFITNKNVYLPLLFVILFNSLPSSQNAIFFYSMNELKTTTEQMGYISIMTNLSVIISMIIYDKYLTHVSWPTMIKITTILNCLFGFLYIPLILRINQPYISDFSLLIITSCVSAVLYQYGFIPFLYFASIIAPTNLRGTGTSIVITCWNIGLTMSEITSGIASKYLHITSHTFDNIYIFILIEKCGKVFLLILLCFVNLNGSKQITKRKNNTCTDKHYNDSPLKSIQQERLSYSSKHVVE